MALTNLTSLTAEQYRALTITSFSSPPSVSSTGSPDNQVSIQLAGWVGTNVLAFTMNYAPSVNASLIIDSLTGGTLDVNVVPGSNPMGQTTYWTIDMGANGKGSNWQITFSVAANSTTTGKWVFVKGKSDDHVHPKH